MNLAQLSAVPTFAVVGHPNKGKSSIVATLAGDDSVALGPEPGTTISCREYPLRVNGSVLYALIDTPGFQRARKVLAWLKQQTNSPAERPDAVARFVEDAQAREQFADEVELLRPIVAGAGILYVVDGSVPYNQEYEAELEILQWTGRPRMALINPISNDRYVAQWTRALGQYFSMVRVFNAVHAEFAKQIELLKVFGELEPMWRQSLLSGVGLLVKQRKQRIHQVAEIVAQSIADMLEFQVEQKVVGELNSAQQLAIEKLQSGVCDLESLSRKRVENVCQYHNLTRLEADLRVLLPRELFSEQSWRLFGLNRREALTLATFGGALMGSGIDVLSGGASLLGGSVIGGILGFGSALASSRTLVDTKVLSLPLGSRLIEAGPIHQLEFPHLVFNRARLHYRILSNRTHARRDPLDLLGGSPPLGQSASPDLDQLWGLTNLGASERNRLERVFTKMRRPFSEHSAFGDLRGKLARIIEDILIRDEQLTDMLP